MKLEIYIALIVIFNLNYFDLFADGCSGSATFTVTYNATNNCYFFTNTTSNDCGSSGICTWDFGDGTPPVTTIQGANTVCHTYNCNNTYTVSLVYDATNCSPGAICSGSQQIIVNQGPNITGVFSGPTGACVNDPALQLQINISVSTGVNLAPYTIYYNLGGASQTPIFTNSNSALLSFNPTTAGNYLFTIDSILSGASNICPTSSNTNYQITVYDYPTASITGSTTVCQDDNNVFITLTGNGNIPPYNFTYTVNNGPPQIISSLGNNSSVSIPVVTNNPGNYIFNLLNVSGSSTPTCDKIINSNYSVLILPKPTATINGSFTVCQNDPSPVIEFIGNNSVPPYTFTYTINGGPPQTITSTSNNSAYLPISTLIPGTFTVSLLSVSSGSVPICSNLSFGSSIVNIIELPDAQISGSTTVCQNSTSPIITFTGSGPTAPYLFTYTVNGGPIQTIASINNIATLTIPTNIAGSYTYNLVSVKSLTSPNCSKIINQTATIIIRALPSATISSPINICQNDTAPLITITGIGGVSPYTMIYSVNGNLMPPVLSNGNSFSTNCLTNIPGVYNYDLISIYDSGNPSCGTNLNISTTINVIDLPLASIVGSINLCQNSPSPQLTINCSGNSSPYLVTYSINSSIIDTLTVPITSANISVPTNIPGIYNYELIGVTGSSSPSCYNSQLGNAIVNINPLPDANITSVGRACINSDTPIITISGFNGIEPYIFDYSIDNNIFQSQSINSDYYLYVNTTTVDTIDYKLLGVTSSSVPSCYTPLNKEISFIIDPKPIIDFIPIPIPCEYSSNINFLNTSIISTHYYWDFGDYNTSTETSPTHDFYIDGNYSINLIGVSEFGCIDSLMKNINVYNQFSIWIPKAFSPNNDLKNELFYPVLMSAKELEITIYNRWGEKVYYSNNITEGWDGTYKSSSAPEGVYVYLITATDLCNESHFFKGYFSLIR